MINSHCLISRKSQLPTSILCQIKSNSIDKKAIYTLILNKTSSQGFLKDYCLSEPTKFLFLYFSSTIIFSTIYAYHNLNFIMIVLNHWFYIWPMNPLRTSLNKHLKIRTMSTWAAFRFAYKKNGDIITTTIWIMASWIKRMSHL